MTNFEFKKDCVSGPAPNLALDSIVIVIPIYMTGRKDFVLWYLRQFGVKRLRRDYGIPGYDANLKNLSNVFFLRNS